MTRVAAVLLRRILIAATIAGATLTAGVAAADAPPKTRPVIVVGGGEPPDELKVKNLRVGKGRLRVRSGDTLTVRYVGANWSDGKEFDASWDRGEPFTFRIGRQATIEGWERGLIGMREGGRRQLVIPPGLAYGKQGSPPAIPANETLVFVVDLVRLRRR